MEFQTIMTAVVNWLRDHGITILIIIIGAFIIRRITHSLIERVVRKVLRGDRYASKQAEKKREDTIIRIGDGLLAVVTWLTAAMMLLAELGIEIGPLLAAAGVAGLAFGFGGQYLIRDLIAGMFIILENQYRVGDVIQIGEIAGSVEDITLRKTAIRDLDGTLHHIPHGEVTMVSNMSSKFAAINLDIGVSYDADLKEVERVTNDVCKALAADTNWKKDIRETPRYERVENLADSAVVIKIMGKTAPLRQWAVTGELRKRLKEAYDKAGIEIPYPQQVVHNRGEISGIGASS